MRAMVHHEPITPVSSYLGIARATVGTCPYGGEMNRQTTEGMSENEFPSLQVPCPQRLDESALIFSYPHHVSVNCTASKRLKSLCPRTTSVSPSSASVAMLGPFARAPNPF